MAHEMKKNEEGPVEARGEGAEPSGKPITVHSHSGYKQDEKPRSFDLDGKRLTVLSIKKTWQQESEKTRGRKTFFQVHCHDGRSYNIALDEGTGQWTLEPWSSGHD